MPSILGANTLSGGYEVANSVRFNSADSAQMNKTLGTATDVDKYTISMWVKRSRLGHRQMMMRVINPSSTGTYAFLEFQADDKINTNDYDESASIAKTTNAQFRDPNAWMHIVLALDSTQGTASNRSKLYVNGTQITSNFSTDSGGSQNQNLMGNTSGKTIYIGGDGGQDTRYCGLYMAEVCFIDGQQLDPTSFGEFDEDSPTIWKPIDVSGLTFGNNGFYLDFEDSSNLGNDVNGGTDLTEVNLAATDQTTDTCTNNFATINPLVRNSDYNDGSLAEGNTYFAPDGRAISVSSIGVTSGKWYAEFKTQDAGALYVGVGLLRGLDALSDGGMSNPIFYDNNPSYAIGYGADGSLQYNSTTASYGSGYSDNNIVGIALDMDNKEFYISVNGTFQASGDPTSGASKTNGAAGAASYNPLDDGGEIFFFVSDFSAGGVGKCYHNYGNAAYSINSGNADANGYGKFTYSVPSGYYSLNSKNLAEFG